MQTAVSSNEKIVYLDDKDRMDKRSSQLLSLWLTRTKMPVNGLREKMIEDGRLSSRINQPSFRLWFSKSRVTGKTSDPDEVGQRVVAIVEAIALFRKVSNVPIIFPQELEEFIGLYNDIPALYRLQLRRLLHELQKESGQNYTDFFLSKHWQTQFSDWAIFGFVVDRLSCIRAYSRYAMALAGLKEEDAHNWYWWHRLALGTRGKSTLLSLRGVYADEYYTQQILRFLYTVQENNLQETPRYQTLIPLLNSIDTNGDFKRLWNQAEEMFKAKVPLLPQIPVPFFRPDKTLLWMLEVSAPIPQTNLVLTARLATDGVESEYLADFRHQIDDETRGKNNALFIEDFAHHFSHDERVALGLDNWPHMK